MIFSDSNKVSKKACTTYHPVFKVSDITYRQHIFVFYGHQSFSIHIVRTNLHYIKGPQIAIKLTTLPIRLLK